MLHTLTIQNVVLIDKLAIAFEGGLCALTGETGAGKSILLDALGLALGARSESQLVRKGAEQAAVTAEFTVDKNHPVLALLQEQGLEADPNLLLRRSVGNDGRSRAFINDQPVSVTLLRQAGELLVEIHGQFDTQSLLNPRIHRDLLDDYAGADLNGLSKTWNEWKEKEKALADARAKAEKARTEEDYLRGAVEDLDTLNPQADEEGKLTTLRERLMRREQIFTNLQTADGAMGEADAALNTAWRALERLGTDSKPMLDGLNRVTAEIQEVQASIQALSSDIEESEHSLQEIDDRLHELKAQARKHGCMIGDLPAKRGDLAAALNLIERQDDVLSSLMKEAEAAKKVFVAQAETAGRARRKAAEKLDKLVAREFPPLKLDKARFETRVETLPEAEWGPGGMERVQFLVATNPGAEAGALNKIASGGEMARFMLALKVVLAEVGAAGTLVFDEVDSGIGGATADAVGERLARLAEHRQILVVTHSPQVAARAAHHWIVTKDGKESVKTNVTALPNMEKRREEIARMISGAKVTEEARAAARKLLEASAA